MFWAGWPFLLVVIVSSGLGMLLIERFRSSNLIVRDFLIVYILGAFITALFLLTPAGLLRMIQESIAFVPMFSEQSVGVWPNAFLTVAEAGSLTLKKLVFLCSNPVMIAVGLFGLIITLPLALLKSDRVRIYQLLTLIIFAIPAFVLTMKTERFAILLVIPIAFFVGFGIQYIQSGLCAILDNIFKGNLSNRIATLLISVLILALSLPAPIVFAKISSKTTHFIMNDVWFDALDEIRLNTDKDSIVNSWWPPGYFINAIASRRSVIDGGTQQLPETYWMAKVFLTDNERVSVGILRMLNRSGNQSLDYLDKLGYSTKEAVDLLLKVVPLNRQDADGQLKNELKAGERSELLDLTHGRGALPKSYLFLYNDMIDKNLAMSIVANWDFEKAKEFQDQASEARKPTGKDVGRDRCHTIHKRFAE